MAPMVGLSHVATRLMVRSYLPKGATTWWPTEMLNSRRLPGQRIGETPETYKGAGEEFLIPQILGNEEKFITPSIQKLEEWGASGIDINMGCPVKKALRHNYGVSLMGDHKYAGEVVRITKKATSLPVSVKIRAGLQKDHQVLLNFVSCLVDNGADWICLHPRTAEQKRKGSADWNQIKLLKEHFQVPIVGNGDIQTKEDALFMLKETDCDSVMIGRALMGRPWLFWQLGEEFGLNPPEGKEELKTPQTLEEEAYEFGRALKLLIHFLIEFL